MKRPGMDKEEYERDRSNSILLYSRDKKKQGEKEEYSFEDFT
jgi:hypothetical protein